MKFPEAKGVDTAHPFKRETFEIVRATTVAADRVVFDKVMPPMVLVNPAPSVTILDPWMVPATSRLYPGDAVLIPTFPPATV